MSENIKTSINSLQGNIDILKDKESNLKGQIEYLTEQNNKQTLDIQKYKDNVLKYKKAVELLSLVQQVTTEKVRKGFERIVTYALRFIFNDDYKFKLEFKRRGNLSELYFNVMTPECKEAHDPIDSCGGGVLDILSLALRVSLLELKTSKDEFFLVLDEAFKHLSEEYLEKASLFIHAISEKINKQIIMITHKSLFLQIADNKINLTRSNNK